MSQLIETTDSSLVQLHMMRRNQENLKLLQVYEIEILSNLVVWESKSKLFYNFEKGSLCLQI